jgi:hypothetical protein
MHKLKRHLDRFCSAPIEIKRFLSFSIFVAAMVIFTYVIAQNILRSEADDPQIQMAEEVSFLLNHNAPMGPLVPEIGVELSESLKTFIQIYDEKGSLLDGNATMNGISPKIPKDVLSYAKEHEENRLTWRLESGVRIAAVISHYGGQNPGYAVAGRSLRETENRIGGIGKLCFFFWLGMMLFACAFYRFFFGKKLF